MQAVMLVTGVVIIAVTIYLLIKQYETRMVLFCSGLLMAGIAGVPTAAFQAFSSRMVTGSLIEPILSVMGFAYVMKYTECDKHLIHLVLNFMKKIRPLLIPLAVLATFSINIALPAASSCAAAVGAVMIPLLISSGIHPAIAASAVFAGTYGSMLSPGLSHNAFIAAMIKKSAVDVISVHMYADIACALVGAITLTLVARFLKEDKDYIPEDVAHKVEEVKVNLLKAIIPILPVVLLIANAFKVFGKYNMMVSHAMLISVVLAVLVTRKNPGEVSKSFFDGMGWSYGQILGIIIAAAVFVSGMSSLGLIKAFNAFLTNTPSIAKIASAFGPFILGLISGSGDAAALAFNEAVTPHAANFGLEIPKMGSMAALGGALGRTASPISGACLVVAGLAKVSPMEIAKRSLPGMFIAVIVSMFMLLY